MNTKMILKMILLITDAELRAIIKENQVQQVILIKIHKRPYQHTLLNDVIKFFLGRKSQGSSYQEQLYIRKKLIS